METLSPPLPVTLRLRKGTPECRAFVAAVNQGIDAHLEAVTGSVFKDQGSVLQAELAAPDIAVLVRRLLEVNTADADKLVLRIQHQQHAEQDLDPFTKAYAIAALWSTNDGLDDSGGDPLEDNYGLADFSPAARAKLIDDCFTFRERHADLLFRAGQTDEQSGHDFWLTRNRHGAGFWDRGLPEDVAEALTEAAHAYGEVDLYIGDDGFIHSS